MKTLRRILALIPLMLLWLMLSALIWGFVISRLTDTAPARKLEIYIDAPAPGADAMCAALEDAFLPYDGIDMLRVHTFEYAMFGGSPVLTGDIFIIPASTLDAYPHAFAQYPQSFGANSVYGFPVAYSAEDARGAAQEYISYLNEDYVVCVRADSVHVQDGSAFELVRLMLDGKTEPSVR
ncbi:MAG: hypothetical protein IKR85_11065 [Clostridia bacterium]|nr:hypothetical protein [Clostridia bacterium]